MSRGPKEITPDIAPEALHDPTRHSVLAPIALRARSTGTLTLAVLGTCVADMFSRLGAATGEFRADHFLVQSGRQDVAPDVRWKKYDAVVIQITLRQLLNVPSEDRNDLSYVRETTDYDSVLNASNADLDNLINRLVDAIGGDAPAFFLSLAEPPPSYQGILLNNRAKSFYHLVRTLNDHMAETLEKFANAHYIEINDVMNFYGTGEISDGYNLHFSHAGFRGTESAHKCSLAIIDRIRDALIILQNEDPIKLIVTDLDNTLWKGVLAELEEFIPHEHIEGWPLGYAEALLEFRRRGGLLAICSKNDYEPTLQRFAKLWQGILRIEDFCSVKVNWSPKSGNILEILTEVNLRAQNTLFIDDNPHEIQEVQMAIPGIRILSGNPETWRSIILHSAETQVGFVSEESRRRTELIRVKQDRDRLAGSMSRREYLESLRIRVKFDLIADSTHPKCERAVELLNKTNQFNTTGKRWAAPDLDSLFASKGAIVALTAVDNFGDNGLVSVAVIRDEVIIQMVLSCRVFGFSLENALLHRVLEIMRSGRRDRRVMGRLLETGKNKTCSRFYADSGFEQSADALENWIFEGDVRWPSWIALID